MFSKPAPIVRDVSAAYRLARATSMGVAAKAIPALEQAWRNRCDGVSFPLSSNGTALRWKDVIEARSMVFDLLRASFTQEVLELDRVPWSSATVEDMGEHGLFEKDAAQELATRAKKQGRARARSKRRAAFGLFTAGPLITGAGLAWNWYQSSQAPWDTNYELATRMMDGADMVFQVAAVFAAIITVAGAVLYFPSRKALKKSND